MTSVALILLHERLQNISIKDIKLFEDNFRIESRNIDPILLLYNTEKQISNLSNF